jgi:quercetin dioxygenase-like cupin family protein
MKKFIPYFTILAVIILLQEISFAQDAVKVDPKHYKVEFENDQVRVLRITYAPGEKGVMHSHPEGMVIALDDASGKFTFPDGKSALANFKAGDFHWVDATTHQSENVGDKPFGIIQIEMKNKMKK